MDTRPCPTCDGAVDEPNEYYCKACRESARASEDARARYAKRLEAESVARRLLNTTGIRAEDLAAALAPLLIPHLKSKEKQG